MKRLARIGAVLISSTASFVAGFSIFAAQDKGRGSCDLPIAWQATKVSCQLPDGCSERDVKAVAEAAGGGCGDVQLAEGPLQAAAHALLALSRGSDGEEAWEEARGRCEAAGGARCGKVDMMRAARVAAGLGLDNDRE